jgi:hypothetical protein
MMQDKNKYEDMLAMLAEKFPELDQQIQDLGDSMADLAEGQDVGEDEMSEEDMGELSIEIEAPKMMKKGMKEEIPAELEDEEEVEMPMVKKKK